jgi:hypothetical protein
MRLATENFFLVAAVAQYGGPTSRTWITEACAIRDELNLFQTSDLPFSMMPKRLPASKHTLKHFSTFLFIFFSFRYIMGDRENHNDYGYNQKSNEEGRKESGEEGCPEEGRKEGCKKSTC